MMLHETIRNDDFLAQHSVATLLRRCFEWLQHQVPALQRCAALIKNRHFANRNITFKPLQHSTLNERSEIKIH